MGMLAIGLAAHRPPLWLLAGAPGAKRDNPRLQLREAP